jgi:RimJ/RimL family protein N-acetyltransferase
MKPELAIQIDKINYRVNETFIDGREFTIRSIRPSDKHNLEECMGHLSPQSRYYRFFTPKKELTEKELTYFTEIDFSSQIGLIAVIIENGKEIPIGFAEYFVSHSASRSADLEPKTAEAAFAVEEEFQGHGVATKLLKHLVTLAMNDGIKEFTCLVMSENSKMRELLSNCGLQILNSEYEPGALNIHVRLAPMP